MACSQVFLAPPPSSSPGPDPAPRPLSSAAHRPPPRPRAALVNHAIPRRVSSIPQICTNQKGDTHDRIHAAPSPNARSLGLLGFPAAGSPVPGTATLSAAAHFQRHFPLQQGWAGPGQGRAAGKGSPVGTLPGNVVPKRKGRSRTLCPHRAWRKPEGGAGGGGSDGAGSLGEGPEAERGGNEALPAAHAASGGEATCSPHLWPRPRCSQLHQLFQLLSEPQSDPAPPCLKPALAP